MMPKFVCIYGPEDTSRSPVQVVTRVLIYRKTFN